MKKINLRESLLKMDKQTDCKYDLTTMYESVNLSEKDKKKLVGYIDSNSPAMANQLLATNFTAMGEELDDDDISDMSLGYMEIDSKSVKDADGFYTDYTMYKDNTLDLYICIFGDKDIYDPTNSSPDFETESEEEAIEWFNDYNGIDEDYEADKELKESYNDYYELGNKIEKYMRTNNIFSDFENAEETVGNAIILTFKIDTGDWKHEHLRFDNLMKDYFENNNEKYSVWKIDEEEIAAPVEDTYSSYHHVYLIPKDKLQTFRNIKKFMFSEKLNKKHRHINEDKNNISIPTPYSKYFEISTYEPDENDYQIGDIIEGYDAKIIAYLDPKDAYADIFDISPLLVKYDNTLDVVEIAGGRMYSVDLDAYLEDNNSEIIEWLSEHPNAYTDACNYFNCDDLESITAEELIDWISEHDELFDDFNNHFDLNENKTNSNEKNVWKNIPFDENEIKYIFDIYAIDTDSNTKDKIGTESITLSDVRDYILSNNNLNIKGNKNEYVDNLIAYAKGSDLEALAKDAVKNIKIDNNPTYNVDSIMIVTNKDGFKEYYLDTDFTRLQTELGDMLLPEKLENKKMKFKRIKLTEAEEDYIKIGNKMYPKDASSYGYDSADSISNRTKVKYDIEKQQEEDNKIKAELKKKADKITTHLFDKLLDSNKPSDNLEILFDELVPARGNAETVAGEIVRAMMRILYRDYNDGDKFFTGYGLETCGPSAQYLIDNTSESIKDSFLDIIEDYTTYINNDSEYTRELENITNLIILYLKTNPHLFAEKNTEDSRDYDYSELKEYEPLGSITIEVPDFVAEILDEGKVSKADLIADIDESIPYECSVSYSYFGDIEIEDIPLDFVQEVEDYGLDGWRTEEDWKEWLSNYIDEDDEEESEE